MDTRFTCVKRGKKVVESTWVTNMARSRCKGPRRHTAYATIQPRFLHDVAWSHLEVIKRSQAKAREEIGRRKSRFA
jgi:hypothetical protein